MPIKLRPHIHLFRQGFIATAAFFIPLFVVLYFMTVPDGAWRAVLVAQVFVFLVLLLAAAGYFRAAIWVSQTDIVERGFFGWTTRLSIGDIGSILVIETYHGDATTPQLFVCDPAGKQLLRMRGQFWSRETMDTVISTLDVPVKHVEDTLSTQELRDDHPGLLYWFERHPVLAACAFTAVVSIVAIVLVVTLNAGGVPLAY